MNRTMMLAFVMVALVASAPAYSETQGMDRRDDRRDARDDARDVKQECKDGDQSRAECRQEKRDTKRDARHGESDEAPAAPATPPAQ